MTGFARVRRAVPGGDLTLSLKSVNHRALDLHFHLPPDLDGVEAALRGIIKRRVARGHVQIHATFTAAETAGEALLNAPLLDAYVSAYRAAAERLRVDAPPDLNLALRIPGMLRLDARGDLPAETEQAVASAMSEALDILDTFRRREGEAIVSELRARCETIRTRAAAMEEVRATATQEFHQRLRERLRTMLRGVSVDPQRLAQEAALLAERSDIAEEILRLRTHTDQIEDLLTAGGEIGKRLDFLLQEMNRESNTILSKTSGLGATGLRLTDLALSAKAEVDKIREQSLNLE